jgi:cytochrome c553
MSGGIVRTARSKAGVIAQSLVASVAIVFVLPVGAQDAKKGEELAQQQCAACHGKDFVTGLDPTYPKLAGQYQDYLEKALRDYKSGARNNAIMNGIAKPLARDDIRNVAAYLSALPGPLSNQKR